MPGSQIQLCNIDYAVVPCKGLLSPGYVFGRAYLYHLFSRTLTPDRTLELLHQRNPLPLSSS